MNSQDSVTDQLLRVVQLAIKAKEYDAADWIIQRLHESRQPQILDVTSR